MDLWPWGSTSNAVHPNESQQAQEDKDHKELLSFADLYVNFWGLAWWIRTLPFVPPDQLLPWLLKNDLLPRGPGMDVEIDRYWTHLASKGLPHTADKPGSGCVPMWLWGDDTRYNEQGAKIVLVAMGAVLDRRKSSKDTTYPLFAYQVDTQLLNKNACMHIFGFVWK